MRAVNLMPRHLDESRSRRGLVVVLGALAVLAALTLLLGVLRMQASAQADGHRADLELTEAALARLPKPEPTPQPATPDITAERSNRIAALQSALQTRVPVDKLLSDLSYVVPDDVWLTGFTLAAPSADAPATAGASAITIEGSTYSQPAVARFLARLQTLSSIDGARLGQSTRVESKPGTSDSKQKGKQAKPKVVITFTVNADLVRGASS